MIKQVELLKSTQMKRAHILRWVENKETIVRACLFERESFLEKVGVVDPSVGMKDRMMKAVPISKLSRPHL